MNINETHYNFDLKWDKIQSKDKPYFSRAQKDMILNEAQIIFLSQHFTEKDQFKGFEVDSTDIANINDLVVKNWENIILTPTTVTNEYKGELPDNLFRPIRLHGDMSKLDCVRKVNDFNHVQHDDLNESFKNAFYEPSFKWGVVNYNYADNQIYLYTDNFEILNFKLDYLKYPQKVFFGGYNSLDNQYSDTDLPVGFEFGSDEQHQLIVDIAVAEASRILEDPQTMQLKQLKIQQNN